MHSCHSGHWREGRGAPRARPLQGTHRLLLRLPETLLGTMTLYRNVQTGPVRAQPRAWDTSTGARQGAGAGGSRSRFLSSFDSKPHSGSIGVWRALLWRRLMKPAGYPMQCPGWNPVPLPLTVAPGAFRRGPNSSLGPCPQPYSAQHVRSEYSYIPQHSCALSVAATLSAPVP